MAKIAAVGDIHSPKGLSSFLKALSLLKGSSVDIFLLVGDIIYKGLVEGLKPVIDSILREFNTPIIAVFGNEEYDEVKSSIKKLFKKEVIWLDDAYTVLDVRRLKIAIVGTRGCLDEPTDWQLKNIPRIREVYSNRLELVDRLLGEVKDRGDVVILASHYPPTYKTLKGEPRRFWPKMACSKMEEVISRRSPTLVVHAHTHNSLVKEVNIGRVKVVNVSLPARREIVVLDVKPTLGLEKFLYL